MLWRWSAPDAARRTAVLSADQALPTLCCRGRSRRRGLQCSVSGRSPLGRFGAPEPQGSDAGQPSFVWAGNRPKGARGGISVERPIHLGTGRSPSSSRKLDFCNSNHSRALTCDQGMVAAERPYPYPGADHRPTRCRMRSSRKRLNRGFSPQSRRGRIFAPESSSIAARRRSVACLDRQTRTRNREQDVARDASQNQLADRAALAQANDHQRNVG